MTKTASATLIAMLLGAAPGHANAKPNLFPGDPNGSAGFTAASPQKDPAPRDARAGRRNARDEDRATRRSNADNASLKLFRR